MTLSEFRVLWMMVIFDLPTESREMRKEATKFRNLLLDNGFKMMQYSVYIRHTVGKEVFDKYTKTIGCNIPKYGSVGVLEFTDNQYKRIKIFKGKSKPRFLEDPTQLTLF